MTRRNQNKEKRNKKEYKNKTKKNEIFNKIMFCIYLINIIAVIMYILNINIIPDKYMTIITAVFVVLVGIVGLSLLKIKNKILNVIMYIIIAITLVLSILGYNYSSKAFNFFNNISNEVSQIEKFYIISSTIDTVDKLDNKYLYMFESNEEYQDVIDEVNKLAKVNYDKLDSLEKLSNKVIEKTNTAILISASQYSMMCEIYKEFEDSAKILHTIEHSIGTVSTSVNIDNEYTIDNGKFNIYISGIDTSGYIGNVSRTDSNMILTIDTTAAKTQIHLTSIPRDYYVKLGTIGKLDKLTHSGIYGIDETIATVEKMLDIDINYYARVNFTTLIKLVDAIGGVEVNSDYSFVSVDGNSFKKGYNYLNGTRALSFARERKAFSAGDLQRNINQQKVIEGIINKVTSSTTIITNYSKILSTLSSSFQTNITTAQITSLVKEQIGDMKGIDMTTYSLYGKGKSAPTYSMGSMLLSVVVPDENSILEAKEKINKILE